MERFKSIGHNVKERVSAATGAVISTVDWGRERVVNGINRTKTFCVANPLEVGMFVMGSAGIASSIFLMAEDFLEDHRRGTFPVWARSGFQTEVMGDLLVAQDGLVIRPAHYEVVSINGRSTIVRREESFPEKANVDNRLAQAVARLDKLYPRTPTLERIRFTLPDPGAPDADIILARDREEIGQAMQQVAEWSNSPETRAYLRTFNRQQNYGGGSIATIAVGGIFSLIAVILREARKGKARERERKLALAS